MNKIRQKLPFLASFIFAAPFLASAENMPQLKPIPYASIATITTTATSAGKAGAPGSAATGVLLNAKNGLILTNIHVIVACFDALGEVNPWWPSTAVIGKMCPEKTLTLSFPNAVDTPTTSVAKILKIGSPANQKPDAILDEWVLLQVDPKLTKNVPVPNLAPRPLNSGEIIRFAGFPASPVGIKVSGTTTLYESTGQIESTADVKSIWKTIYKSLSLPQDEYSSLLSYSTENYFDDPNVFFHDAPIMAGYSGSPVFDTSGSLIGIVFGTAGVWDFNYGNFPDAIGYDPSVPEKPANKLSAGILLKTVCDESKMCQ